MGKREGHLECNDGFWFPSSWGSRFSDYMVSWLRDEQRNRYRWVEDGVVVLLPRYDEVPVRDKP